MNPANRSASSGERCTAKRFGTTVPRTPSVRPASTSRTSRRPISTGCRPLRNALRERAFDEPLEPSLEALESH